MIAVLESLAAIMRPTADIVRLNIGSASHRISSLPQTIRQKVIQDLSIAGLRKVPAKMHMRADVEFFDYPPVARPYR